jgi:MFS superfamily sulfate permease-like transporter
MPKLAKARQRKEMLDILKDNNEERIPRRFGREEIIRINEPVQVIESSRSNGVDDDVFKIFFEGQIMDLTWLFPVINTIHDYSTSLFFADIRAASSIAFVLIPQAIAFSSLAGVTPIRALVSAIFPLLFYSIFGASRQLSVGPEALSSVLVGLAVGNEVDISGGDPNDLASALALLVGIFALVVSIIRGGFIDNILSGYLLTGFVLGVAILIIIEQIPAVFGLTVAHSETPISTFMSGYKTFSQFHHSHLPSAALGISSLLFLIGFKFFKERYHNNWISQIPEVLRF